MATSIDVTLVGSKEGTNTLQYFFVAKKNLIIFCVEEGQVKNKLGGGEEWGSVICISRAGLNQSSSSL